MSAPWLVDEPEIDALLARIALKDSMLSAANVAIRDLKLEIDRLVAHYAMEREVWESRVIALENAQNGRAA